MTHQTGSNNRICAIWAGFGLQFGRFCSKIVGVDANLNFSFLTVFSQNCILIFKPVRAKLLSEIGVSVTVNRTGFLFLNFWS